MDQIKQRARALLAAEHDKHQGGCVFGDILRLPEHAAPLADFEHGTQCAIAAISAALRSTARDEALAALEKASDTFREYEKSHRAKAESAYRIANDAEWDERQSKADRNREMAETMEAAIRALKEA